MVPGTLHSQMYVPFDQAVCLVEIANAVSQTTRRRGFSGCVSICSLSIKSPEEKDRHLRLTEFLSGTNSVSSSVKWDLLMSRLLECQLPVRLGTSRCPRWCLVGATYHPVGIWLARCPWLKYLLSLFPRKGLRSWPADGMCLLGLSGCTAGFCQGHPNLAEPCLKKVDREFEEPGQEAGGRLRPLGLKLGSDRPCWFTQSTSLSSYHLSA